MGKAFNTLHTHECCNSLLNHSCNSPLICSVLTVILTGDKMCFMLGTSREWWVCITWSDISARPRDVIYRDDLGSLSGSLEKQARFNQEYLVRLTFPFWFSFLLFFFTQVPFFPGSCQLKIWTTCLWPFLLKGFGCLFLQNHCYTRQYFLPSPYAHTTTCHSPLFWFALEI